MRTLITSIALFLLVVMFISLNVFQSSMGPHGGIVKSAGEYNIEMKNVHLNFYAYLLDKDLKPISNKGVSCEVKFIYADGTSMNISLKPIGLDGFSKGSSIRDFYSCVISFNVFGKSVSSNFENDLPIAQEKINNIK